MIIYAQSQGHGVRCAQSVDRGNLAHGVKILRFRGHRPEVPVNAHRQLQVDATYELDGFDAWYAQALGPFGVRGEGEGMFEDTIALGDHEDGRPLVIGYFIAGRDHAKGSWSRPKPPRSWDDAWDEIPIFTWHFFPAEATNSHAGRNVSERYLHNRPCEKTFGRSPVEVKTLVVLQLTRKGGDKWKILDDNHGRGVHGYYWKAAMMMAKRYVNYLFHALG